ncbi:MAG: ferrous iron transporter B [Myxococcales bacterium]|nr:ferrous iron transporter B [Myxococcales bacterium]
MSAHRDHGRGATGREGGVEARETVVLVGRPNAGKSSLYNRLTGAQAKVGNFPGVTVEVLEGRVEHAGRFVYVIDLPGLYSLEGGDAESDEGVARRFLSGLRAEGRRVVLVQVLDATCPAVGLRLTRELCGLGFPLVIAATRGDVLEAEGRHFDATRLADALGLGVRLVSARAASTREAVLSLALDALGSGAAPTVAGFDPDALGSSVLREADTVAEAQRRARQRSARLDRWLLAPVWGPVLFVLLMSALFGAVFYVADPASALSDRMMRAVAGVIGPWFGAPRVRSFVVDGVLGGAGTVITFLPQIVVLTLVMELLDASGYLARGVFLVDRFLRGVGLGGRGFVPLLTGHACAVPAIAATRIIRNPRERLTAILVIPLMTCSARVPTYSLLLSAFFASRGPVFRGALFVSLYVAGVAMGLVASAVLRRTVTRGKTLPLVIEMPAYHRPELRVVGRAASRAAKNFLKDVGTTILAASAVLWVLLNVPAPGSAAVPPDAENAAQLRIERSVAAAMGRALEPVTRLAGFDWRINVGLIGSFGARELMVGTLGVISGVEDADDAPETLAVRLQGQRDAQGRPRYSPAMAAALLAFFVVACQCMSTVAAIKRETRSWRWALFTLGWTYALGFALAVAVYQLGSRL